MELDQSNANAGIWIIKDPNNKEFGSVCFDKPFFTALRAKHGRNTIQQLGIEAYRLLLEEQMGKEKAQTFLEVHNEVKIVVTEALGDGSMPIVRIKDIVIPLEFRSESERTYLFLFEKVNNENIFRPVGGLMGHLLCDKDTATYYGTDERSPVMEHVTKGQEHWIVERCMFAPGAYYNEKVFKDRQMVAPVIPPVNHNVLPMQFYINDVNGSPKTNFTTDDLIRIIRQRGEALLLFANYKEIESGQTDSRKLENMRRVVEEKLFVGIPEKDRWDVDYNGMICLATVALFQNERVKQWIFVREANMAKFRIKYQYHSEDAVVESLKKNRLTQHFPVAANMPQDLESACMKLFMFNFKTRATPTRWFKVDTALAGGSISSGTCTVRDGYCYLSYVHLQIYVLPELVCEVLENYQDQALKSPITQVVEEEDSLFNAIKTGAAPLINRITELVNKRGGDRGDLLQDVPDIEDCIKENLLPPCSVHHHMVMERDLHLRHGARFIYSRLLMDMGFQADAIMDYFCNYFTKRGDYTREKFYKEFKSLTKVTVPFVHLAPKCENMMNVHTKFPQDCTGCPFVTRGPEELVDLLRRMRVKESDHGVIKSSAKQEAFSGACLATFKSIHGEPELVEGVAFRPERYFEEAVKVWKKKNGKVSEGKQEVVEGSGNQVIAHQAKRIKLSA